MDVKVLFKKHIWECKSKLSKVCKIIKTECLVRMLKNLFNLMNFSVKNDKMQNLGCLWQQKQNCKNYFINRKKS